MYNEGMNSVRAKLVIFIAAIALLLPSFPLPFVHAAESCTVSVSPSSVTTDSSQSMSFSVTNTGDVDIIYIKVTRPSSNFTLFNNGGVTSPWSATITSSEAEVSGGTLGPAGTLSFSLGANIGSSEAASADWGIQVYGSAFANCTGTLGTAITGAGDTTGPVLSQPVVSDVTGTTATIGWTTDEGATSKVNYGTSLSYGSEKTSSSLVTTHSVSLTGLAANTSYYFAISSTDGAGNNSSLSGYSFTTAATASTGTTATTVPVAATAKPAATSTPGPTTAPVTISRDSVNPRVNLDGDYSETFEEAPTITGSATDNETISSIDYSIDGGANWLPVDVSDGLGSGSATFEFTPILIEDGDYTIVSRAIDAAGNIGQSTAVTIVIDKLPPRIGGTLIAVGPQPLVPNESGIIVTLSGLNLKLTMSTVGGANEVGVVAKHASGQEKVFEMIKSAETNLWSGSISLDTTGSYIIAAQAKDGAGNTTGKILNRVSVVGPGNITSESDKSVDKGNAVLYVQDPLTNLWAVWDAKAFSQENPQSLTDGSYQYFIPPGKYYLEIAGSLGKLTSDIFSVETSTPLNSDFEVSSKSSINIFGLNISLPNFTGDTVPVKLKRASLDITPDLVGDEAPVIHTTTVEGDNFDLREKRGDPHIVSFVSTWSPPALEQVAVAQSASVDDALPVTLIMAQESAAKTNIFARKGEFTVTILPDETGELVEEYEVSSLPTHFFIDRTGVVRKVLTGVLSREELMSNLDEVSR